MLEKLLGPLARRWPAVRTAMDVQERFSGIKGTQLASAVTLMLFTSLFPALLVAIAVIGYFTSQDGDLAGQIISNLGLAGDDATLINEALAKAQESQSTASLVGIAGLIWAGLGVGAAIEHSMDTTWQHTGRNIKDKFRVLLWGAGAVVILGVSLGVTAVVSYFVDGWLNVLVALAAVVINIGFVMWTFNVLAFQKLPIKAYLPGSIFAGIGLEVLKQGAGLLASLFSGSSALYGSIGAVFSILAIMLIFGRLLVYASVLNVIKWEQVHGTVTIDIEVPRVPGEVPTEAGRTGAVGPETEPEHEGD